MRDFEIGDDLFWLRGDVHMVASVIEVKANSVKIQGMTTDYWVMKETLRRWVDKPYPIPRSRA